MQLIMWVLSWIVAMAIIMLFFWGSDDNDKRGGENMETLQSVLKDLYCCFGGDRANVNALTDVNAILENIALLGVGDKLKAAEQKELPELPESDGTYSLQVVIDEGEATYSWEAVT